MTDQEKIEAILNRCMLNESCPDLVETAKEICQINTEVAKEAYQQGVQGGMAEAVSECDAAVAECSAEFRQQKQEFEKRIADLKADKTTYCAYCGKEFPVEAEGTVEAVSEHIHNCPLHPIQDYKAEFLKQKLAFVDEILKHQLVEQVPGTSESLIYPAEIAKQEWWQSLRAKFLGEK